jgi:hypothetical protein
LDVGNGIAGDVLERAVFHQEQLHGCLRHLKVELTPFVVIRIFVTLFPINNFKKTMLLREENIREGRKTIFLHVFTREPLVFTGKVFTLFQSKKM